MAGSFEKRQKVKALMKGHRGRCHWCGKQVHMFAPDVRFRQPPSMATLDHIVPKSRGGGNGIENLVLSCRACNGERGDMSAEEFMALKCGGAYVFR